MTPTMNGDGGRVGHRLLAVDALRGVAAMAVVLYHVPQALRHAAGVPRMLDVVFLNGLLGVDAFFVLSGFVISMSVASGSWSVGYLLRFVARRSVRLDPSYWAAIAIELALGWAGVRFLGDQYPFPSLADILAHLAYLQGLLHVRQISDVFWTLCFEVQFYLLLVGLLVVSHVNAVKRSIPPTLLLSIVGLAFVAISLAIRSGLVAGPNEGLALIRIYQFALGISAYLYAVSKISVTTLSIVAGGIIAARMADHAFVETAVMLAACTTCYVSIRSERFNQLLDVRPLQFLGRISYSLYLYHASIIGRASAVTRMLAKPVSAGMFPLLGLVAGLLGSILFSYVMFRLVEAPTMKLSRRIRMA